MQSNKCIWLVSLRLSIAVTHTHCSGVFTAALEDTQLKTTVKLTAVLVVHL